MAAVRAPRFKSRTAALRFYFRASELLTPTAKPGTFSKHPPKIRRGPNAVHDFVALDSCFWGMKDVQLWLLREVYRPAGFGTKQRSITELFEGAKRQFPDLEWTPQEIARSKQEALKIFEAHLKRERLM